MWGPPSDSGTIDPKLQRRIRRILEAEEHNRLQAALESSPTTLLASLPPPTLHRPEAIKVVAARQFEASRRLSQPATRHAKSAPWYVCSHWTETTGVQKTGCGRMMRRNATGPLTDFCRACSRQTIHLEADSPPSRRWGHDTGGTADVLLQGAPGGPPFWIYVPYKLTKLNKDCVRSVCGIVRRALLQRAALDCDAETKRCGLLVDFLTTASTIATGRPHQIANVLYTYIDQYHSDLTFLKFVFVGLTDNQHVRTARDVFSRDASQFPYGKRSFDAIDSVHMFAATPEAPAFVRYGEPMLSSRATVAAAQARHSRVRHGALPPISKGGTNAAATSTGRSGGRGSGRGGMGATGGRGGDRDDAANLPRYARMLASSSGGPMGMGDANDWLTDHDLTNPAVYMIYLEGDTTKGTAALGGGAGGEGVVDCGSTVGPGRAFSAAKAQGSPRALDAPVRNGGVASGTVLYGSGREAHDPLGDAAAVDRLESAALAAVSKERGFPGGVLEESTIFITNMRV